MAQLDLTVHLSDGTTHRVQPANPDMVRFDLTAARNNWPSGEKAPFFWMTFLAWAVLKRTGLYPHDFEQFSEHDCLELDNNRENEAEDEDPKLSTPTAGHTPA